VKLIIFQSPQTRCNKKISGHLHKKNNYSAHEIPEVKIFRRKRAPVQIIFVVAAAEKIQLYTKPSGKGKKAVRKSVY